MEKPEKVLEREAKMPTTFELPKEAVKDSSSSTIGCLLFVALGTAYVVGGALAIKAAVEYTPIIDQYLRNLGKLF